MNDFFVVGLNHKTAPVELRERCRIHEAEKTLRELKDLADEAAPLSTCNRFEIYAHGGGGPEAIVSWIAGRAGVEPEEISRHAYVRTGRNACKQLFFVTASLDSLVVGETQIRHQVREAYRVATEGGGVGPNLHRLFQSALRVSKEIAERTGVGRGNVSVAGAAADLAERVFGGLADAAVLVVGAGETAELVIHHLTGRGVARFRVVNRTPERARELAERYGAEWGGLDELGERLAAADIWVTAAGGDEPLVKATDVRAALRRRRGRPVVAIDIAVPRGIDPRIDAIDNVYRYDMDALVAVTQDALRHRRQEFLQCCMLIDAATLRMSADERAWEAGTAISELEETFHRIAEAEWTALDRKLPELAPEQREQVRRAIRHVVRKLLHMPLRVLREGGPEDHEVIRKAFLEPRRKEPR